MALQQELEMLRNFFKAFPDLQPYLTQVSNSTAASLTAAAVAAVGQVPGGMPGGAIPPGFPGPAAPGFSSLPGLDSNNQGQNNQGGGPAPPIGSLQPYPQTSCFDMNYPPPNFGQNPENNGLNQALPQIQPNFSTNLAPIAPISSQNGPETQNQGQNNVGFQENNQEPPVWKQ